MDRITTKIEDFTYDIIYILLWLIELTLFLRFLLKLFGANPYNPVINFVYSFSSIFMGVFTGIFSSSSFGNNMILEPSVLVAMAFYAIIFYVIVSFLDMLHKNNPNNQNPPS